MADWEVADSDMPPTRLSLQGVLSLGSQGRLGLRSQVRRATETAWTYADERAEVAYAFPRLNLLRLNPTAGSASGVGAVHPDPGRVLDLAREFASDSDSAKLGFFFSAHVPQATSPVIRNTHLYRMWPGFYVGPVIESRIVKPGGLLNVYVAAFNLADRGQQRTVVATETSGLASTEWDLKFALGPWKWTVLRASIPTNPAPGWHQMGFYSVAPSARTTTAAAVGLMSLGSVLYVPGYEGFSLQYGVLTRENAETVTTLERGAIEAATRVLSNRGADAITTAEGHRVPAEVILQWFGLYLTPERVVAAIDDSPRPPEETKARLFDAFLSDAYGVGGVDPSFPAP